MRIEERLLQILAVDCRLTGSADEVELTAVESIRAALAEVRAGHFDLLLTRRDVAGEPVWPLAEKVRRVRPKLHWWLVAHGITPDDEVLARTLGVTRILGRAPTADAIHATLAGPRPRWLPVTRPIEAVHVADVGT